MYKSGYRLTLSYSYPTLIVHIQRQRGVRRKEHNKAAGTMAKMEKEATIAQTAAAAAAASEDQGRRQEGRKRAAVKTAQAEE